jgi:chromosome partitioning protein
MPVYAVLSLKGGVGKSTTAIHFAACAAAEGKAVIVIDADEEKSAVRWATHAALPFEVLPANRNALAQQVRALQAADPNRIVIIDSAPNNREMLTRAGMVANVVVVPVVPTGLDIDRLAPTLELLRDIEATRGELDVAILLTRWAGRKRLAREALEALGSYPVLDAKIRALTAYEEAFGGVPGYLDEYQAAWKELAA